MDNEVRNGFNEAIENAHKAGVSADEIAKMELCREWFTNEDFRAKLSDYVFSKTSKKGA